MSQLVLTANTSKIEAAFERFHRDHPEVYRELVRLARELRDAGYRRFGIATIYEVARWRSMLATPRAGLKLNNNFRAYYARLIMAREPDLAGAFDTRALGVESHIVP